ncbi:MAG: hypothetical protein ACTSR1_01075 [Candidatus Heimdallarchaeota archaeon]
MALWLFGKRKKRFEEVKEKLGSKPLKRQNLEKELKKIKTKRRTEALARGGLLEKVEKKEEKPLKKPAEKKTGFIEKVGEIGKKIPLVSSAFKLGGKLAVKGLSAAGVGTPEQREQARAWWGGRITAGDVLGTAAFAGAVAGGTLLAGRLLGGAGKAAGVRFMGTQVGKGTLIKAQATVSNMNRFGLKSALKAGFAFAKSHKALLAAHQTGTILTAWFAGDNLLTLASMNTRDISSQVRFGNISQGEALAELDSAVSDVNAARWTLRAATISNPLLYPLWFLMETTGNSVLRNIEMEKQILERM